MGYLRPCLKILLPHWSVAWEFEHYPMRPFLQSAVCLTNQRLRCWYLFWKSPTVGRFLLLSCLLDVFATVYYWSVTVSVLRTLGSCLNAGIFLRTSPPPCLRRTSFSKHRNCLHSVMFAKALLNSRCYDLVKVLSEHFGVDFALCIEHPETGYLAFRVGQLFFHYIIPIFSFGGDQDPTLFCRYNCIRVRSFWWEEAAFLLLQTLVAICTSFFRPVTWS